MLADSLEVCYIAVHADEWDASDTKILVVSKNSDVAKLFMYEQEGWKLFSQFTMSTGITQLTASSLGRVAAGIG